MDIVIAAKKVCGNEWLPKDDSFKHWLWENVGRLPEKFRVALEMSLEGKRKQEIAKELGITANTANNRVMVGLMVLSVLLGDDRSMFKSIREFEFSGEVDGTELGMCFYGRLSRNVQTAFLPAVRAGKVDLPMPVWKGGKWVWSREDAIRWREWYIGQREGVKGLP